MSIRTDLALESKEIAGNKVNGVRESQKKYDNMTITKIDIVNKHGAETLGKDIGTYITAEFPTLTDDFRETDERLKIIGDLLNGLLPDDGLVLVVGLGNTDITPDALGPKSTASILATRHISGELARSIGLDNLRPVAVIAPGVLGKTGVETGELVFSIADKLKPSAIIAIDALASRRLERLGCTLQISDTGISPGAGVGNHRNRIDKSTTGVPVIAVGIPTVVDAATLAVDILGKDSNAKVNINDICPHGTNMVVTPREIDMLVMRGAKLISMAINIALQRDFEISDLLSLVN
ncbi:MAG TPA: GPR endopeptidase [Clostridiales bacterium]|nr:GPR endopeptidase [Clostridiales bacterium]